MRGRRRRSELTVLGCHHGFGCRLSGFKIQIAFLGETKRTIPRRRPASGIAPCSASSGPIRTPPAPRHRNFSFKVLRRPFEPRQYTSIAFGHRCREAGVRPSMGSVGDAYDNAMCESFFATLECELLERCRFKTRRAASKRFPAAARRY